MSTELELQILLAAEKLFLEKGFAGTSTTDIAREVGCNQALVHYYYRTKERLFQGIFEQKFSLLLDYLEHADYNGNIVEIVSGVVDFYFVLLTQNPKLPFFVMNELVLNPERRRWIRLAFVEDERRQRVYYNFSAIVKSEIEKGNIRQIEPLDLLLDIASLVVMTFVSLPIYQDLLLKSQDEVDAYLSQRKHEILTLLFRGLLIA